MATGSIAQSLARVSERIAHASRVHPHARAVQLVAVSKTKPNAAILEAYSAGHRHFGENYVQELVDKAPQLPADIQWHFIGHLQSNKAKLLAKVPNLALVECIDSEKLATALNKACSDRPDKLSVLIQVNTSEEGSKSGCDTSAAVQLFGFVLKHCDKLAPVGLMTIGKLMQGPEIDTECFQRLASLRDDVLAEYGSAIDTERFAMSMGMSGDFELAIQHGATIVRIGSTIFGEREYAASKPPKTDENEQERDK